MESCLVLVPKEGTPSAALIDPGSAVVSDGAEENGRIMVWFEGNRHRAVNLTRFHDRTVCAAGRMSARYLTVARASFPRDEFEEAASFSIARLAFTGIASPVALERWAGESLEDIAGKTIEPGIHGPEALPPSDQMQWLGRMPGGLPAFRTRAGQVVAVAGAALFEVLGEDDPRAEALMRR